MNRASIAKLEERIAKLETVTDSDLWTPLASDLLHIVEFECTAMFPVDEADDDYRLAFDSNAARTGVWPLFELLRILSTQAARNAYGWESLRIDGELNAGHFADAIRKFINVVVDANVSGDDSALDGITMPVNPVSLHVFKSMLWRGKDAERYAVPVLTEFGVPDAMPIFDLLARVSPLPPWDLRFPVGLEDDGRLTFGPAWPDDVRGQVAAALAKSQSMPPSIVEPFDLRSIPRYRRAGGPWPELTGGKMGQRYDSDYTHRAERAGCPTMADVRAWQHARDHAKPVEPVASYSSVPPLPRPRI